MYILMSLVIFMCDFYELSFSRSIVIMLSLLIGRHIDMYKCACDYVFMGWSVPICSEHNFSKTEKKIIDFIGICDTGTCFQR